MNRLIDDYTSQVWSCWDKEILYANGALIQRMGSRWKGYLSTSYTPEVVKSLMNFRCAKEVAGDDEIVRKRIEFLQMGLNWSAVEGKLQRMLAKLQASEEIDKEKAHSLLQSRYELMSDIFKNNHYAINVTAWAALFGKRLSKLFGWEAPEAVTSNVKKEIVTDGEGEVL